MATLSPLARWKARTNDGRRMAAGWVSARHTPPKRGEYEVRGHPRNYLTWAYGHWWYLKVPSSPGGIPYWFLVTGHFAWRDSRPCDNTCIHGGDLLLKAVELGSEEAEAELRAKGWTGDYRPYAGDGEWRRG